MEHLLVPLLSGTLVAATPLIYAAMGELVAERSGVLNLGVDGADPCGFLIVLAGDRPGIIHPGSDGVFRIVQYGGNRVVSVPHQGGTGGSHHWRGAALRPCHRVSGHPDTLFDDDVRRRDGGSRWSLSLARLHAVMGRRHDGGAGLDCIGPGGVRGLAAVATGIRSVAVRRRLGVAAVFARVWRQDAVRAAELAALPRDHRRAGRDFPQSADSAPERPAVAGAAVSA